MTTEDAMVLAADALKSIDLTQASDEGLALYGSLLYEAARKVSKEQGDRIQARFNTQMEHGVYEEELATIRGTRE
jgi:hypothetical protein